MAFLYKNWTTDVLPGTSTWQGNALLNNQVITSPQFPTQVAMNAWIDAFPQPVAQYIPPGAMPGTPTTGALTPLQQQQYQLQQQQMLQQQALQSQQAMQLQQAQQQLAMQRMAMMRTQQQPTQTDASKQASPVAKEEKPFWKQPLVIAATLSVIGGILIARMRMKKKA
jgi:hypothetical protein